MNNFFKNLQKFYLEHRSFALSIIFVVFVAILSTLGQSKWFKSSLLEVSNPFNGTIYPIELSPNYLAWPVNVKTDKYSSIDKKYLVKLPNYEDALKDDGSDRVRNAQLTFPVVYLGNYEGDHEEGKGSHLAVDIRVPVGTPIKSIANGTVSKVDMKSSGFGHHVCVKHSNVPNYPNSEEKTNLISCYNHMDQIFVSQGDFVFKGEEIGTSGNTGTSTTPHLHFQIDNENAPWHPYWPFTFAEASSASLSFFDAVTVGLNQDQAKANTVNPMNWIASNYSEAGSGGTLVATTNNTASSSTQVNTQESKIERFDIIADTYSFDTGEQATLTITAKDQNNSVFKDYKASSKLSVGTNSNTADFKKSLRFVNGVAKLLVSNTVSEDFNISINEENASGTISLTSLAENLHASASTEENTQDATDTNTKSDNDSEETVSENSTQDNTENVQDSITQTPTKIKISGQDSGLTNQKINFFIEVLDQDNAAINSLDSFLDIKTIDAKGKISKNRINADDLINGKVKMSYESSVSETAKFELINQEFTITVLEEIKSASGFKLYTEDDKLLLKTPTTLYIQAIDSAGKDTPNYNSIADIKLEVLEGEAILSKSILKNNDFDNGLASIQVTASGKTRVKIKAQNGAYIGESGRLEIYDASNENIFTDVSSSHKNATAIKYLKENEIIGGYADGSFQPNKEVSRIEALKMLLLGLDKGLNPSNEVSFPDTDSNSWYAPYIGRALKLGMVKGYPEGVFKPANPVNRAEYYKILLTAAGAEIKEASSAPFTDVALGTWFTDFVAYAKDKQITDAKTNFNPSGNVSRAEVAETIYRVLMLNK